jgi:hypothetical protein
MYVSSVIVHDSYFSALRLLSVNSRIKRNNKIITSL